MSQWGKRADMVVHESDPFNAEPPPGALAGAMLTGRDSFYSRNHGPIPEPTVAALSEPFDPKQLTLPFLLMHGYADRLADPEQSRAFHAAAGSDDKILVLWAGLFHEIFNEPPEDREEPLERLERWLDEHVG